MATIKCDKCGYVYEYEECSFIDKDGVKVIIVDTMPDGYFLGDGRWVCNDCIYVNMCSVCGLPAEDLFGLKIDTCDCR